jgi:hypothetical protein
MRRTGLTARGVSARSFAICKITREPLAEHAQYSPCVFNLALAIAERPLTQIHAAKIEADDHAAAAPQTSGNAVDHLVVHRPAMQGVRMANQRRFGDDTVFGFFNQRFEAADGAIHKK